MIWLFFITLLLWGIMFVVLDASIVHSPKNVSALSKSFGDVTFVICARNEAECIWSCLESIANQDWDGKTQIFVVDDHSTDETMAEVRRFEASNASLKINLIELKAETGKKAALRRAVQEADTEFIYFLDADVVLAKSALQHMMSNMTSPTIQVVLGPVLYTGEGFFPKLMQAENLNNQAVTEAFVNRGRPIMANGANMLIRASVIEAYLASLETPSVSGDDVFFVQSLNPTQVCSCHRVEAAVYTYGPKSLKEFWNQRLRWSNKSKHYAQKTATLFAMFVFICSLVFCSMIFLLPFTIMSFLMTLILGFKWLIELGMHRSWFKKYGHPHSLVDSFFLSLLYPFYVVIIGVASILGFGFTWKGREHNH